MNECIICIIPNFDTIERKEESFHARNEFHEVIQKVEATWNQKEDDYLMEMSIRQNFS